MFRTYEPTRDRLIAVKVFRIDATPEQAEALAGELSRSADAGLFHPSIVEPVAAGVEGTVAYRAEEYVAGESLDVAMRHYAPASLDKALPFITQLAGAIDFARAAGIGHGALHLRDVFVTPDEARASGFGIVEALERVGLRAPVRRPYSAPERIAGAPWGTPADVFSLAAIAYELLTGRRAAGTGDHIGPLAGDNLGEHAEAVGCVLARAMDEDPAVRYQSALAFASALEAAARGEHVTDAVARVGAIATASPQSVRDPAPIAPGIIDLEPEPEEPEEPEEPQEPQEPWDIEGERDADEAYGLLSREEQEEARIREEAEPAVFDEEAVEDLALDVPEAEAPARFAADEFDEREGPALDTLRAAPVPVAPAREYEPPVVAHDDAREARAVEPPRAAMLPLAVTLIIGLLVGFAAGYAVGQRDRDRPEETQAESGAEQPAKEWSEQAVTPPPAVELPSPAAEAPPAAATPPEPAATAPAGPPAARPAPTTGRIVVRSTPSRAGVTVNGVWRGRTPLTLERQPFGKYEIRIVQTGYAVAREAFALSAAEPDHTLNVRLERGRGTRDVARPAPPPARESASGATRYTGTIYVDSRPRGARVFVDGKQVGTTPMRLPEIAIGSHVVRLELDDHRTWTTSTRVAAGQETRVTGSLERIR